MQKVEDDIITVAVILLATAIKLIKKEEKVKQKRVDTSLGSKKSCARCTQCTAA